MKQIRVLLADDHPVVRAGVRAFLEDEPDMLVVGETSTAYETVVLAKALRPDVVVMDISMPGSGLDATRQIRSACQNTQVLILTFHAPERFLLLALRAGATGYVLKSVVDAELIKALRVVAGGDVYVHPSNAKLLVDDYYAESRTKAEDAADRLNERELEVIRLFALGYSASESAQLLLLSPKSVETYRCRIMQKLGIHSRAGLVQYALKHNLLKEELEAELT